MNKITQLIANGKFSVQELAQTQDLIERAKLVTDGLEACKKTLKFPLKETIIQCYYYADSVEKYESWGTYQKDGIFTTCSCNQYGIHINGKCDLNNFANVFLAFEDNEFKPDLERFLRQQIEKAKESE